jgi:hypothetical protein
MKTYYVPRLTKLQAAKAAKASAAVSTILAK